TGGGTTGGGVRNPGSRSGARGADRGGLLHRRGPARGAAAVASAWALAALIRRESSPAKPLHSRIGRSRQLGRGPRIASPVRRFRLPLKKHGFFRLSKGIRRARHG